MCSPALGRKNPFEFDPLLQWPVHFYAMSDDYRQHSRNALLVKDDIGRAKPTVYDLPQEGHTYGRSDPADMEGAREVTMHWAAHVPRPQRGPECQDIIKVNKTAAKSGIANARQLAEFRKGVDIKLSPPGPPGLLPKVIPSDVIPSFAYGRKSRPSTPIEQVVGNQYALEAEKSANAIYQKYIEEMDMPNGKRRIKLTKACTRLFAQARNLRRGVEEMEFKEPFKLSKFKKVPGRLKLEPINRSVSLPNLEKEPQAVPAAGGQLE